MRETLLTAKIYRYKHSQNRRETGSVFLFLVFL
jgi:hypothetical protein